MPVRITARAPVEGVVPARQTPEEEARDILAAAVKNQVECGPGTRRAAVRAIKYLRTLVNKHGATMNEIHTQARLHTQKSKGMIILRLVGLSQSIHTLSTLPAPTDIAVF